MREILYDPRVLIVLGIVHLQSSDSIAKRIMKNPSWVRMNKVNKDLVARIQFSDMSSQHKIFKLFWGGESTGILVTYLVPH